MNSTQMIYSQGMLAILYDLRSDSGVQGRGLSERLPCHRDWELGGRGPNSLAIVDHPHIINPNDLLLV